MDATDTMGAANPAKKDTIQSYQLVCPTAEHKPLLLIRKLILLYNIELLFRFMQVVLNRKALRFFFI